MTAPVPEQAVTAAARVAAAGAIYDLIGAGNLPIDRGQLADRFADAALEAAVPAIRDHLVSQLAIADTMTCGECNYPLHRCPACRHLIGHDGYDDHQCRVAGIPHVVIDVKGEITPGQAEELKAKWKAAWQAAGGRPELPAGYGQIQEHREVLAERVAELEALAADMLRNFFKRDNHYEAYADAEQVPEWEAILKGRQ